MRWVIALVLVVGLPACNKAPSEDDCKQLLDHMVDLELKKSGTAGADAAKADLAKAKASIVDAKLTDGYVDKCTKNTPKSRVACALNASDLDGVARCDEGK
jgi:hypothetical protein